MIPRPQAALVVACMIGGVGNAGAQQRVLVRGSIVDSATQLGIPEAIIELQDTRFAARSAADGSFILGRVPAGAYAMRVSRLGYAPAAIDTIRAMAGDSAVVVRIALRRAATPLAAVVVTPGFYGMMQTGIATAHTLSRQQIETAPQLGEDVYRAAARLPGVSSNDMSARFNVRGASGEELYATLDGLELDEPFHLKDIDAALSILDVSAIAGVELSTGGFPAEYGNRLTGIFKMHSVEPQTDRVRSAFALSILNARYTTQGGMRDGRLGWYVSARRGYLDIALKLVSEDDSLSPRYYDVFSKIYLDLPRGGRLTLHALVAGDHLNYVEETDHLNSRYGNRYLWATWAGDPHARFRQSSVLSLGRISWRRGGDVFDGPTQTLFLDDRRSYDMLSARQDWLLELSSRALLKVGAEVKRAAASYDYHSWSTTYFVQADTLAARTDTNDAVVDPSGNQASAYLSQRVRLLPSVTAEAGLRYDRASWSNDSDVSPRFNISWDPTSSTTVRAAWGRYSQPQSIYGLQAQDGLRGFAPAERAEQRGVGVEQGLPRAIKLRVELYDRALSRLRPRFVNQTNELAVFAELEGDRLRVDPTGGRARGIETFIQRQGAGRMDWSASYALAEVTERIGSRDVPRAMDQRHTINGDWAYRPLSNRWRFSVATVWHSGWPATPSIFTVDTIPARPGPGSRIWITRTFGPFASERLREYHRFDVRFTRYFDTRRGRVSLYADVFNLFGSANARGYAYSVYVQPQFRIVRDYDTMLPRLPSLGLSWEF